MKKFQKGFIPRPLFLGEMRKISREMMNACALRANYFLREKNFTSPVSRSQLYSLRKRKE